MLQAIIRKHNLSETMTENTLQVFVSYSHKDEPLKVELSNHLKLLEYQGLISVWHDRKILPGDEWDHQISQNLEQADIILLLVSSDFIASKYCWDVEVKRAIELHEFKRAVVIPVILRSVDWTLSPFGKLQALPQNAQPITSAASKDDAMRFVSQEVRKVAMELIEKKQKEREMAKKMVAISEYKKMYEGLILEGKISPVKQFMLDDFQRKMGLTDEDLATLRQNTDSKNNKEENRATYKNAFQRAVEEYGFPLLESIRKDLDLVLDYLALTHPQVTDIEQQVVQHYIKNQTTKPKTPPVMASPPPSEPTTSRTNYLSTKSGIDYTQLEVLLKEEKWELADKRTRTIIYELADRTIHNGLRIEDMKSLPCEDLSLLNRLWEEHSGGWFGFAVQRDSYFLLGNASDFFKSLSVIEQRTGFYKFLFGDNYVGAEGTYERLKNITTTNLTALPKGYLPAVGEWTVANEVNVDKLYLEFYNRINDCLRRVN